MEAQLIPEPFVFITHIVPHYYTREDILFLVLFQSFTGLSFDGGLFVLFISCHVIVKSVLLSLSGVYYITNPLTSLRGTDR